MNKPATSNTSEWTKIVVDRIKNIRFGTIELVIHQGIVTQIGATEKIRIENPRPPKVPPYQTTGAATKPATHSAMSSADDRRPTPDPNYIHEPDSSDHRHGGTSN